MISTTWAKRLRELVKLAREGQTVDWVHEYQLIHPNEDLDAGHLHCIANSPFHSVVEGTCAVCKGCDFIKNSPTTLQDAVAEAFLVIGRNAGFVE